jgi:2-hydroxy-3-keto-5-methylthiopentenyl-1-phosphate phosphatase
VEEQDARLTEKQIRSRIRTSVSTTIHFLKKNLEHISDEYENQISIMKQKVDVEPPPHSFHKQVIHQHQDLLPASMEWMLYKDHLFPPEHKKHEISVLAINVASANEDQHSYFTLVNTNKLNVLPS